MTQQRQINKPIKINRDKSPKYLGQDEAYYMLNAERSIGGGVKSASGKTTPLPANELMCTTEVEGTPIFCGAFRSELTNEVYAFYLVEDGLNYILRVNEDKTCEIVCEFSQDCFFLSAEPEHAITQWRCYLKYDKFCAHQGGKQLIVVNGIGTPMMVDIEASIATNSFTTEFFDLCADECAPFQMCVPQTCGAIEGEFIPLTEEERDLNNKLVDVAVQVAIRHVYYDQRATEINAISTLFYQDSKGCFDVTDGFPRCLRLRVPIGNPLVDKVEILFRYGNNGNWFLSDTVEKYESYTSDEQQWYERELKDLLNFSEEDCAFDYIFCNDKQCSPVPDQFTRTFNPIPRDAQGMIRIKDSLAFYNYVKGNCPINENETKKIELSLNCEDEDACNREYVDVTFYALVHNNIRDMNQPIFRYGGDVDDEDDDSDTAWFGGLAIAREKGMGNYFRGKVRNFIGYIEGTDYAVELEQWYSPRNFIGTKEKAGVLPHMESNSHVIATDFDIINGNFFYQKGVFKVPKGTKGFIRLGSHKKTSGIGSNQNFSTFVYGKLDINDYEGNISLSGLIEEAPGDKELYFDTTAGDVELTDALVVLDMVKDSDGSDHSSTAYAGYLTDENGNPVEGAEIWSGVIDELKATTDFNGFYFFYMYGGVDTPIELSIRVEHTTSGAWTEVQTETVQTGYGSLTENDFEIDEADYDTNWYQEVNIALRDCDLNPVGGVRVAISGGKFKISDGITGIATFRVRNYVTRDRVLTAVVVDNKGCFIVDCDGNCNPAMPEITPINLPSEFDNNSPIDVNTTTNLNVESALVNVRGLKAGGRYAFGVVIEGDCGRLSGVYPITILNGSVPTEDGYMNIPKTQEKDVLSFCTIDYNSNGVELPDWGKCLHIVRTRNINNYELQWVVDKIEKIGNNKIKLTIQSLNDYNARYNFETTTKYQYVKGDRIEFISNGDGEIFDTATYGILNYQILSPFVEEIEDNSTVPETQFFNEIVIQDDGSLDGLIEGAKIELQRPKDCTIENDAFFAVFTIGIIDVSGVKVLAEPSGNFNTFDTYFITRQVGSTPIQIFESKNPSDFWGDDINGISDIGKAYFINKFENERRFGRNISINSVGVFNRFGDLEKTLDAPEHGDLTSLRLYDGKIGIGIGEFDNFRFSVSDDFLRLGSDGIVRAAPADSLISDTEPKPVGQFGCQYEDIGSIWYGDGWIIWADVSKGALVKHNIDYAKDMAEGQFNSYLNEKFGIMRAFNGTSTLPQEKYRFITGFNYHTKAVQFTIKQLTGDSINNQKDALLANNETFLIEPRTEEILTFASYTQDGYSNLNTNDDTGCAFISFVGNNVYLHPIKTNVYNRFNGVAVDRVVTFAINQNPDIIKRAVGIEIQSELMYFSSKVLVDRTSFESEIPPKKMEQKEDKWVGNFLCDKNSRGGIYATGNIGVKPRGYFILVTLVRDNTTDYIYGSENDANRILYDELDMILTKYFYSSQSGFVENL